MALLCSVMVIVPILELESRNKDRQRQAIMSNFNDLLDASVDAGLAWARRHTKQPEQPAVVLESEYLQLRALFKEVVAQRDAITAQRDIWMDTMRAFVGHVLNKDEANAYMRKLAKERGVPWRG